MKLFAEIDAAVRQTVSEVVEYQRKINSQLALEILFGGASRTAINCSTGTGKTRAMIAGIADLLRTDARMRVVIAVPTHKLGQGLAARMNAAYGSEIAAEWYGIEHPDPRAPEEKMCRLADAAKELLSTGGELQLLCSRRRGKMQYCPHHPKKAGANACRYLGQQQSQVKAGTRVWIIPSVMLAAAPPDALKREKHGLEGDLICWS